MKNTKNETALEDSLQCFVSWHGYRWGLWFRIFGHGVSIAKSPPRFSERCGYVKTIRLGKWRLKYLPANDQADERLPAKKL